MTDFKKYVVMENIIQNINKKYISLPEEETEIYQLVMNSVKDRIIEELKKDELFKSLFRKIYFGGSYFDQLKVGKAEEFDLDIILALPKLIKPRVELSNQHGFVHLRADPPTQINNQTVIIQDIYKKLLNDKFYLTTDTMFFWMQGLLDKVFNRFTVGGKIVIEVVVKSTKVNVVVTKMYKQPAFTLNLSTRVNGFDVSLDVDLVPCFQFGLADWPNGKYRKCTSTKQTEFLLVPKKPKVAPNNKERYWRLSFQEQEKELISSNERMKPAIRLLKKLRDQQNHPSIASYFIKTIFLWEALEAKPEFWQQSLSVVFMTMLNKYGDMVLKGNIPYFWNKDFNLIQHLDPATRASIGNRLKWIVSTVDRNLSSDPFLIATFIIDKHDVDDLKANTDLGKKNYKNIDFVPLNPTPKTAPQPEPTSSCILS